MNNPLQDISLLTSKKIMITSCDNSLGHRVLQLLSNLNTPIQNIFPLSFKKKTIAYGIMRIDCIPSSEVSQLNCDVIINTNSKEWLRSNLEHLWKKTNVIVDMSDAFQLEPQSMLIAATVNSHIMYDQERINNILVTPYSASIALSMIFNLLQITSNYITLTTLQSISNENDEAVTALLDETKESLMDAGFAPLYFDSQIACNIIPQIGEIDENGYSKHEKTIELQVNKILGKTALSLSISCIYVPITTGDSLIMHIKDYSAVELKERLEKNPYIIYNESDRYMTPHNVRCECPIYIGRVKKTPHGVTLWACWDGPTRRALNALQTAEEFLKMQQKQIIN